LGIGGALFGVAPGIARAAADKSVEPKGFVVINGWVLPSQYFRNQ